MSFLLLLSEFNKWASENYPLTVGIDCFNTRKFKVFHMSALSLYDAVYDNNHLTFVFYYYCYSSGIKFLYILPKMKNLTLSPTGYLENDSVNEKIMNSMIKLRSLLENSDNENAKIYKHSLEGLLIYNLEVSYSNNLILNLFDIHNRVMDIYNNNRKKFIFQTHSSFRMVYCLKGGGKYVEFNKTNKRFETRERFFLVTADTKIILNAELVDKISKID